MAAACGLNAARVDDRAAVTRALDAFLADPRPTLLEVMVPPGAHASLLADLTEETRP